MSNAPIDKATKRMRLLFSMRGAFYMLLIVFAFYLPTQWLIPDEQWLSRVAVWLLGWYAAFAVDLFDDWYRGTW